MISEWVDFSRDWMDFSRSNSHQELHCDLNRVEYWWRRRQVWMRDEKWFRSISKAINWINFEILYQMIRSKLFSDVNDSNFLIGTTGQSKLKIHEFDDVLRERDCRLSMIPLNIIRKNVSQSCMKNQTQREDSSICWWTFCTNVENVWLPEMSADRNHEIIVGFEECLLIWILCKRYTSLVGS